MKSSTGGVTHPPIEFQEPLESELRHFLDCIRQHKEPRTGIAEGFEVLKIIEAGYESSRTGQIVAMEPANPPKRSPDAVSSLLEQ